MKRGALLALLLLAAIGPASAQSDVARELTLFHVVSLQFDESDFTTTCDDGVINILDGGRGFEFREAPDDAAQEGAYPAGMTAAGCGTVAKSMPIPQGTDHLLVRFDATRSVEAFFAVDAGAPLEQEIQLRDATGTVIQVRPVFGGTEGDRQRTPIEMVYAGYPGDNISLEWTFHDRGFASQAVAPNPASGQAFAAQVFDAEVTAEQRQPAALLQQSRSQDRDGTTITSLHRVVVPVEEQALGVPGIRLRVLPDLQLEHIVAPDGQRIQAISTLEPGAVVDADTASAILEIQAGHLQVTLPTLLTDQHGPGDYAFVFAEAETVEVSPGLVPLSFVLLVTPLPFAALAWVEARAFAKESFGAYSRSARNLQIGVGLVVAYYGAVVLSAFVGGRLALMAWWPMPLEGVLLYVQLILAGVAFTALWLVARELYMLVRPRHSDDAL